MDELIRCNACRGTKQVAKLGGIFGDCNTCNGTGKIKAIDKPVPVIAVQSELVNDIIEATERVSVDVIDTQDIVSPKRTIEPVQIDVVKEVAELPEPVVKKATSRKVFKRKKTA